MKEKKVDNIENMIQFLTDNRTAVIQEMAKCLNIMNGAMGAMVETDDDESGEKAKEKILYQLFHTIGAMTILFNQFSYLENGEIPEENESNPIGFANLLNKEKE